MDFIKPPFLGRLFFRRAVFKIPNKENKVFLTFDDGPNPEITPFILASLRKFNAKATFFCLGQQVEKYPDLFAQIIQEGHAVGNHGFHHINGWKTPLKVYIENVNSASQLIESKLFRPPYGKITLPQARALSKKYQLILWDVSAQDYRIDISAEQVYQNVVNNTKSGSVIVLHDNVKANEKLRTVFIDMLTVLTDKFNLASID